MGETNRTMVPVVVLVESSALEQLRAMKEYQQSVASLQDSPEIRHVMAKNGWTAEMLLFGAWLAANVGVEVPA